MAAREAPPWARNYIGIPFEPRGRDRDGLDCWGLVRLVYAEQFGVFLPSLAERYSGVHAGDAPEIASVVNEVRRDTGLWEPVPRARVGDVLHMRGGRLQHVGVATSPTSFLHAVMGANSCLERLDQDWRNRLLGVYRYIGPVQIEKRFSPFEPAIQDIQLPAGATIADIIVAAGMRPSPGLRVFIGDREIPEDAWDHVRPRAGRRVLLAMAPLGGGGGGKTILRLVASIAIIAGAIALGPVLAGAIGFSTTTFGVSASLAATAGQIATGIIGLAGTLALNALIPPSSSSYSGDSGPTSSPSLTGSRNSLLPYGVVPQPFGAIRMVPPLGAATYTEIVGDDQYLRCLFVIGKGRIGMSDPQIGGTPLEQLDDYEIEYREGLEDDPPLSLFPGTVLEQPLGVLIKASDGWVVRTSDPDADELSVDVTFPSGLLVAGANGSRNNRTVTLEVQYSPAGSGNWMTINGVSPDFSRGMDFMFRSPESTPGGNGVFMGDLAFGAGTAAPRPSYLPANGGWSWEGSGYIYAETPGQYQFALDCSDAGEISIDSNVVVSWYGSHAAAGAYGAHTGTVTLSRGWHRIAVRVESRSAAGSLSVGWKRPGDVAFSTVPAASLSRLVGLALNQHVPGLAYRWFSTGSFASTLTVTSNQAKPIRRSLNWAVPVGQYDVRIRRVTADTTDTSISDQVYWTTLRSIRQQDPIRLKGVAKIALRIRATDQIQGTLDNFSVFVNSIEPDWDEATQTWIERATSTPASHFRNVLSGRANARPLADSRVSLEELQAWAEETRERGLEYNGIIDTPGTVRSVLQEIAAAGRATLGVDTKFTVVRDRPQSVPRQHFTPRNSFGFKGTKAYPDIPHALRVQFLDKTVNYQRRERLVLGDHHGITGTDGVRRDAFAHETTLPEATLFETLEIKGVVTAEEAFSHGRYYLAVLELRPEMWELSCDAEHLRATRGDLVLVTHDVPLFGLGSGRIVGLVKDSSDNLVGLTLDAPVVMDAGDQYVVRVRTKAGMFPLLPVVTAEGEQATLTLVNPIASMDDRPAIGDLFAFGRIGQDSRECIVKAIETTTDLAAKLTLVDHSPEIHAASDGPIPPYDAGISLPASWENYPNAPVIESIRSDDLVMVRDPNGSLRCRILITLAPQSGIRPIGTDAEVRIREVPQPPAQASGPWSPRPIQAIDGRQVSIFDVEEGVTYEIRIRVISAIGAASPWTETTHTVVGKSAPPPDVVDFTVTRLSDGTRRYDWRLAAVPPDIAGVHIRYGTGSTWETLQPLHADVLQASPAELNVPDEGTWTMAIKAVDTSGNESVHAKIITVTLGPISLEGVAASDDCQIDNWPGVKVNCHTTQEGGLEADDTTTWDALAGPVVGSWDRWTRWVMFPKQPISYEHVPLDAGFVFDFTPDVIAEGGGDLVVEVAWSIDDSVYSDWTPIAVARGMTVTARYLKARVSATITQAFQIPVVNSMLVLMRAATLSADVQDLNTATLPATMRISPGDIRIPLPTNRFSIVRNVIVTFNGLGPGWSWELVDRDPILGPRVRLYNAAGVLSDGLIDALVTGL